MGGREKGWKEEDTLFFILQILCLFNNFAKVLQLKKKNITAE